MYPHARFLELVLLLELYLPIYYILLYHYIVVLYIISNISLYSIKLHYLYIVFILSHGKINMLFLLLYIITLINMFAYAH